MSDHRIIRTVEELEALDPDTVVLANDHELGDVRVILEERSISDGSLLSPLWLSPPVSRSAPPEKRWRKHE